MKKKFIKIILFCLVVFGVFTVSANAAGTRASGTCGTNLTWTLSNLGELTISGTGEMATYTSGEIWGVHAPWLSYKDYVFDVIVDDGVTSISGYAFYGYTDLESITLPSSVTSIGSYAFNGCNSLKGVYISDLAAWCEMQFLNWNSNPLYFAHELYLNNELLTSATIPSSVTSISNDAFLGCTSLTDITIGSGVTSIGNYAFQDCSGLQSVTIPDSVTSIGGAAFYGCTKLASITLPGSVTSIGASMFSGCSSLKSITIPDSVTSIGDNAFNGCSNLESIVIGSGVTTIGSYTLSVSGPISSSKAFYGCIKLKDVYISDLAAWCGIQFGSNFDNPLYYAHNLYINGDLTTDITIPSDVKSVNKYAFYNCTGLESITIPNSVTSIGVSAFSGCTGLESVTMGSGAKSISESAFSGCTGLTDITVGSGVTSIDRTAFADCTGLQSVTIPNSVTSIGAQAFRGCSDLKSVTFGSGVTSIGESAFNGCTSLADIFYLGDNWYYVTKDFNNTPLTQAKLHYVSSIDEICTIALEKTENGTVSLSGIAALKGDTVSVTYSPLIGYGVDAITVDGRKIEGDSFTVTGDHTVCVTFKKVVDADIGGSCGTNLFWALDPANVLHIYGAGAMANYSSSGSNLTPWNSYAARITGADIDSGVTSVGSYAFNGCTKLASITIPDSVTSIGGYAFSGCTGLTGITIPDSVTSIGSYAFYNCTALKSVKLGSSVEKLDVCVFRDCKSLESITIPKSVTSIDRVAFSGCTGLTSITVDANNPSYASDEYGVLYNKAKTALVLYPAGNTRTSYAIKSGVTSVGSYAFNGCTKLASITIPDSVTSIGSSAFNGCTALTGITLPDSVESIGSSAFYGCEKLQSIAIPEGVSVIDSYVFDNCTGLKSVIITAGVERIGNYAFDECRSLKDVYFIGKEKLWNLVTIGSNNFYLTRATMHYISSVEDVCTITLVKPENGTASLSGIAALKGDTVSVTCSPLIGYGVDAITVDGRKIEGDSFTVTGDHTVCVTFKKVAEASIGGICGTTNVFWALDTDNVLHIYGTGAMPTYSSSSSNLTPWWGYRSKITGAVIGDGVTSIGSYAFYSCTKLTSITLPGSLTSISSNAFSGCTGLSEVRYFGSSEQLAKLQVNDRNLPDKRLWKGVGGSCGEGLSWELTVSGELLIDGQGAMTDFTSAVAVPWNPYLDRIRSVTIGEQITHIGSYAFQDCKIGPDLDFSPALQSIGAQAFSGCTTLKTILLKSKLSSIGSGAFAGSGLYLIVLDNESLLPVSVASDALPARIGWGVHKMSIYTVEQLKAIGTDPAGLSRSYILMADIDLEGEDWNPIGSAAQPFTGEFDGNGHTIGNLKIRIPFDYTGDPLLGLFGHISGEDASIQNLTLTNVSISVPSCYVMTDASVGALVGRVDSEGALPVISNCSVSGKIEVSMRQGDYNAPYGYYKDYNANAYVGGLIGSGRCRIENCTNLATVTADYTNHELYVGGIIGRGESRTEIVRCRNLAVIRGKHGPTDVGCGGIAGRMNYNTMLDQCVNHSTVSIQGSSSNVTSERLYAGGIAGYATTQITNCYNDASVYCGDTRNINYYGYGGGIVGLLGGDPDGQSFYQPSVKCSYTMGSGIQLVTAGLYGADVGGIAGLAGSATDTVVRGMEFQKCATALMGAGARLSVVQCSTYGTTGPRLTKYVAAITSGNCTMSNCYYYCPDLSEYFTVGSGVYSGSISSKSVFTALAWDTQNAWYWEADSSTYGRPHLQIEEDTPTFVVGYDGSNLTLRAVLYDGGKSMNIFAAAYSADGKLLRTELLGNIIRGNLSYDAETLIYKAPFKLGQTDHVKFFFTDRNDRPIMLPYFQ